MMIGLALSPETMDSLSLVHMIIWFDYGIRQVNVFPLWLDIQIQSKVLRLDVSMVGSCFFFVVVIKLTRIIDNKAIVFSGSLDHSVLAWEYSFDDESYRLIYECKGHKGPVESIATDSNGNYVSFERVCMLRIIYL